METSTTKITIEEFESKCESAQEGLVQATKVLLTRDS